MIPNDPNGKMCFPSSNSIFRRIAALMLICVFSIGQMFAQNITLNVENASIKSILQEIQSQTNYRFVYNDALINVEAIASISVQNASLQTALNTLFEGTGITFETRDNQVILKQSPPLSQPLQERVFTGRVIDEATGETLPFATVRIRGTTIGTVATMDGYFSIAAPANAVLIVSYTGYETLEIPATGPGTMTIRMRQDAIALEAVVVTGFQTLSRERVTGSFAIVSGDRLENKLQPSVSSLLEGQAAGLVLNRDGEFEVRGISTFDANRQPLIVVDGFPLIGQGMSLDFINPDNIESITVLKDAVAASIYGSQSSNGVIVITTRTGSARRNRGHSISYRHTQSFTLKPDLRRLNLASVADFMDAERDLFNQNPGEVWSRYLAGFRLSDYQYLLMAMDRGLISPEDAEARIDILRNNNALQEIQDHLMRARRTQQHNFSLMNSSEYNNFGAMLRYMQEDGHLIHDRNTRLSFDINNTWIPNRRITLRMFSNFNRATVHRPVLTYSELINPPDNTWLQLTNFDQASLILPYSRLFDNAGNPTPWQPIAQFRREAYETTPGMKSMYFHPVEELKRAYVNNNTSQIRIGGDLSVNFTDFLSGSVGGAWTTGSSFGRGVYETNSFMMRRAYNDGTSRTNHTVKHIPEGGRVDETRGSINTWVIRTQLNYNQSFNNYRHRIMAIIGTETSRNTFEMVFLPTRLGYCPVSATFNSGFNAHQWNLGQGPIPGDLLFGTRPTGFTSVSLGQNYQVIDRRAVGWYGNASYEFNDRYIISGSVRWELSNFYGTDPRYRYRPTWSVGGTWKMEEESFFANLRDLFSRFQVRSSFGVLGSNSLTHVPWLVLGVGQHNPTTGGVYNSISGFPNRQLRYERKQTFNAGIDMTVLRNRVDITLDYYRNRSYDLIASEAVDQTRGTDNLIQNVGGITNIGLETTINARIVQRRNFRWASNLVISYNVTNVDHFSVSRMFFRDFARAQSIMVQGYPANGFWGARFAGLDGRGVAMFHTNDGRIVDGGSLTADDAVFLGTMRPPFNLGWTNTFRYRNWEMSFMFISQLGAKFRRDAFSGSNFNNRHVGQRWREPGDERYTIFPRLTGWNMDMFFFPFSDVLVASANFLKLRDFTLAYEIPRDWVGRTGLSSARLNFQMRNLFYITARGVDVDPEVMQLLSGTALTGPTTNQAFASLQLRPEFHFGISVTL